MKIDADPATKAIYFRLKDSPIVESEEVAPGIVYDFSESNEVVGIEILNLDCKTPEQIKKLNIHFSPEDKSFLREVLSLVVLA